MQSGVSRTLRIVALLVLAVAGTLVAVAIVHLAANRSGYSDFPQKLGKREHIALTLSPINPAWIISGSPVCRANIFDPSHDRKSSSGIWECTGPAKFDWHYGRDESIYLLDGAVEIEYMGKKFSLAAGDSTHFAAGTKATWVVPQHVRKTYRLYEPGRLVRYMRRLFN
jgi:uncharacterized cupin superfamily protein